MSPSARVPGVRELWSGVKTGGGAGVSSHASVANLIYTHTEMYFSVFILCVCLVFIH